MGLGSALSTLSSQAGVKWGVRAIGYWLFAVGIGYDYNVMRIGQLPVNEEYP
jgi:hypothetical protein